MLRSYHLQQCLQLKGFPYNKDKVQEVVKKVLSLEEKQQLHYNDPLIARMHRMSGFDKLDKTNTAKQAILSDADQRIKDMLSKAWSANAYELRKDTITQGGIIFVVKCRDELTTVRAIAEGIEFSYFHINNFIHGVVDAYAQDGDSLDRDTEISVFWCFSCDVVQMLTH